MYERAIQKQIANKGKVVEPYQIAVAGVRKYGEKIEVGEIEETEGQKVKL